MRAILLCLGFVGCASYSIEGSTLDEVAGTCAFTVQFAGGWSSVETGRQTIMVRPYSAAHSCARFPNAKCDNFRELCTSRIGTRDEVYETTAVRPDE